MLSARALRHRLRAEGLTAAIRLAGQPATIAALMARAKNELVRVPGAAIPGVLAPTIFFLGLNGVFGALTHLTGFSTGSYESFIVPVSMLQGAGFTGAAAGVNLARDIEQGWLDRLLVSPAPALGAARRHRAGGQRPRADPRHCRFCMVASRSAPSFPGVDGLLVAFAMVAAMAAVAACWGSMLALRFKSQSAAPLMQAGTMAVILTTTAYAPLALLQGWLQDVARVNPVTQVIDAARQGFVGGVTWADTWPGVAGAGRDAGGRSAPWRCARCAAPHCEPRTRRWPKTSIYQTESTNRRSRSPSGCCGGTGERGSGMGSRYAYTQPSPGRYPWQWYWDSCFAAIVWRRFDPARARAELESLLAAQRPDGFIGHTIFWDRPVSLGRLPFYNVASRQRLPDRDDPAAAAGLGLADRRRRPGRRAADRRPDRLAGRQPRPRRATGCSGSSSPTSRGSTPRPSSTRSGGGGRTRGSASPAWCGATAGSASTRGACAIAAARSSARCWSTRCGRSRCRRWGGRRRPRRWSSGSGTSGAALFLDEVQPGGARPGVLTWAALAPLALPDLPEEIGRRLVEEHLLNEREFLTPVAPPSVAASEPSYEPGGGRGPIRRYWRGPTWVNSAWMVWLGMRRLGYEREADAVGARA